MKFIESLQFITNNYQIKAAQSYECFKMSYKLLNDTKLLKKKLTEKNEDKVREFFNENLTKESVKMGHAYIDIEYNIPERKNSILNMTLIYLLTLLEGYIRDFFKKILKFKEALPEKEFDKKYYYYTHIEQVIKEKYNIDITQIFNKWKIIKNLRSLRNKIVHKGVKWGKNIDLEIVQDFYSAVCEYFANLEHETLKALKVEKKVYSSFVCEYFESWEKEEEYRLSFKMSI